MSDWLMEHIELEKIFSNVDEILHNWEMVALGETFEMIGSSLEKPLKRATELVICKSNYKKGNLQQFVKLRDRLYDLENTKFDETINLANNVDEQKRRIFICWFVGEIEQCLDKILHPFIKRHKLIDPNAKPLFFDDQEHIEFKKASELLATKPVVENKYKLKWKGQKNQLYAVLRQLKENYELIDNSYNSLADFIIQNVVGFENTSKETIEKELKRKEPLPKPKRVIIDLEKEDEENKLTP